ncbi:hypothetical protein [[Hallella] seregens]|uniref:hypothetical protein n=1 Tax=Hallella seregens TaxID=52229 RepID=UPI0004B101FB|nr:hypothetical protein [Hallella seregens]
MSMLFWCFSVFSLADMETKGYICTENDWQEERKRMEEVKMTKEVAMARFMAAKRKKQECVDRMSKELKEQYEKETGLKARYISVL